MISPLVKIVVDRSRYVAAGLPAVGYQYFNLDNGWQKNYKKGNSGSLSPGSSSRDPKTKRLLADPDKFPNGMKAWCDEVHNAFQGAKCGIYTMTCLSEGHWDIDADTFADWGVGAYSPPARPACPRAPNIVHPTFLILFYSSTMVCHTDYVKMDVSCDTNPASISVRTLNQTAANSRIVGIVQKRLYFH
eukprot:COSAG02_NODE_1081_length_14706_cov_994.783939_7_plen_189_part_00